MFLPHVAMLAPRVNADDLGSSANSVLDAYFALHITSGHILLPALLVIFLFSKSAVRHPTLVNVVISFIISSIAACLLLYFGQDSGPEPNRILCIAQTGMLNGVPPMWSVSVCLLVYNVWDRFARHPLRDAGQSRPSTATAKHVAMAVAPYAAGVIWALAAIFVSISHPDKLNRHRRFFYCSVEWDPFSNAVSVFAAAVCLVTTIFEIHLASILYRNYRILKAAGQEGKGVDLKFVIRVLVFGLYIIAGMIISLVTVVNRTTAVPDMFAATIGLAVFFVFGTQSDVLRSVLFWLPAKSANIDGSSSSGPLSSATKSEWAPHSRKRSDGSAVSADSAELGVPAMQQADPAASPSMYGTSMMFSPTTPGAPTARVNFSAPTYGAPIPPPPPGPGQVYQLDADGCWRGADIYLSPPSSAVTWVTASGTGSLSSSVSGQSASLHVPKPASAAMPMSASDGTAGTPRIPRTNGSPL